MKLWNVKLSVVSLVTAETAEDAIDRLKWDLGQGGFDVYEGDVPDAFESENVDNV